jgi:membrane fusion protein (multidrug efflux system)
MVGILFPILERVRRHQAAALEVVCSLLLAACTSSREPGELPRPPIEVSIVTLEANPVLLTTELPGRTLAYETAEVRPQVSGIIVARRFDEGQAVKKGQLLYQIDSRLYRAAVDEARANLAKAVALRNAARSKARRYAALSSAGVVSDQDRADATSAAVTAAAAVQQARAARDTARLRFEFAEVRAPISGRIGRSLVTTGALVTANQAEPLATIAPLQPMLVDFQESSAALLALRRTLSKGAAPAGNEVRLKLEDGSDYEELGTLQFTEASVDANTGSVTLRARFANAAGLLLPGMYVRGLIGEAQQQSAVLAPSAGVIRGPEGTATAFVLGPDDRVIRREIEVGRVVEGQWLIGNGLAAGDRLIVEGTDKVTAGQVVTPISFGDGVDAPRLGTNGKRKPE